MSDARESANRSGAATPAGTAHDAHPSGGGLEPRRQRNQRIALLLFELAMGLFNLAYMRSDQRSNQEWMQRHVTESRPRTPPDPSSRPSLELRRLIKYQLDLDREANFTTWFSSTLAAMAAMAAFALAVKRRRRGWSVVGTGFLLLSADEVSQVHEWIGIYAAHSGFSFGALASPYPWVLLLGPIFLGFATWMLIFLLHELSAAGSLRAYAVASMLALALVIPLELVGAKIQGPLPHPPRLAVIAEESLEMIGTTLFLFVALTWIRRKREEENEAA